MWYYLGKKLKGVDYMKKIIVVGALSLTFLASSVVVYGATSSSLIGAKVQGIFSVKVNGAKISDAVAINGLTYVPLRSLTESIGGTVQVEGKTVSVVTAEQSVDVGLDERSIILKGRVYGFETDISTRQKNITYLNEEIASIELANSKIEVSPIYKDYGIVYRDTQLYKDSAAKIADLQAQVNVLNAEITDLQAKKAVVEAELAS